MINIIYMPIAEDLKCPSCGGGMRTAVRVCGPCGVRVEGDFGGGGNEFSRLSTEELHLLRIFVHTEGSIREMESALGISYPTVKARVAALREKLGVAGAVVASAAGGGEPVAVQDVAGDPVAGVLAEMKCGRLSAADAAKLIRELRNGGNARRDGER